ncbi:MAG: PAS domain-containing protein [Prevotellaceae bacterium]|nr:PAS domain-containing protein [Prevotellaceae bacterium]
MLFAGGFFIAMKEIETCVIKEAEAALSQGVNYRSKNFNAGEPHAYFNYQTLLNKGIDKNNLPIDAIYNNVSISLKQRYLTYLVIAAMVLVLGVFVLSRRLLRKQTNMNKQEQIFLLQSILDNLPIAAKVKDVNNGMRYTFWNKESERIFEASAKDAIGKTDFEVLPEVAAAIRSEDNLLVSNGIPQQSILRFYNRKNKEMFIYENNNLINFSDGRKWILFTAWDITEMKTLERNLKLAKEEAEEANRIKSAFLANMSHEIRTPLNAIVGFSSLLAYEETTEEEREEYAHIIAQNNDLLLQLINDILDLAKIEAGTLEFIYANVDVNRMLGEIAQTAQLRQTNANVPIKLELAKDELILYTDQRRVTQVVNNFLTNAMKFTSSGSITIGYEKPRDGFVRFFVRDTGSGIPSDKVNEVFNRFVKLNAFKQGTGLGLAISQNIIKELKGHIGVQSKVGEGSTFWFMLPDERRTAHQPVEQ